MRSIRTVETKSHR